METIKKRFRLSEYQDARLREVASSSHLTLTDAVHLLIMLGPINLEGVALEEGDLVFDAQPIVTGEIKNIVIELAREQTNVSQSIKGFEHYLQTNLIDGFDRERYPDFPTLTNDIQKSLFEISSAIGRVRAYVMSFNAKIDEDGLEARRFHKGISVRFDQDELNLLGIKAESFSLKRWKYFRCLIDRIDTITQQRNIEHVLKHPKCCTFLRSVDMDELLVGLNRCGKVFNEAVHYLNGQMLFVSSFSGSVHRQFMSTFLEKLEAAIEAYRTFEENSLDGVAQ